MAHPNVDIVVRMYDCFNKADLDTIRKEIFAPDLVWNLPGRHPLGGSKKGPEEVLSFFHELNKSNIQVTLVNIDSWGDETVVEVHRGQGRSGDAVLDALNCTHYHIKDGKIDHVQVYMSDQYAADNFFWAIYNLKPIPDRLG
ncbi:MAG TPA: nuclear transport factor 2 family protein [Chthonomonadaceae bacterium]|nr:nuclear transport factor 2 family protein [Chthonomonadaceae bacterium]